MHEFGRLHAEGGGSVTAKEPSAAPLREATDEELVELRDLWLSRLMFGGLVEPALQPLMTETRTFEQFLEAHGVR